MSPDTPQGLYSAPTPGSAHITAQSLLVPTIQAWHYYLDDQGNSIHTVKAFAADLQLLANYLPPEHTLGNISTTDLNNFLDWMQNIRRVPCSPKTLARRITSIKAFFRWLHQNGIISIDPAEKVIQKTAVSPIPEVLTDEEVSLVLDVAEKHRLADRPDARMSALVQLLLSTGIKKGECLSVTLNHIDLEAPEGPLVFVRYASPQNRYKERKINLPEVWIPIFQEYRSQYQLTDRLFPWSPRRLEYLLEDLSVESGLQKHLSFDMCRWTCALMDWKSGMERNTIRQKLGISKIQWREVGMKLDHLASSAHLAAK
jgi:site-specific recombinase XerD